MINVDAIPSELKERNQWVLWKKETRNGKPTKVPYAANGYLAKANDPATWSSFDSCINALVGNGSVSAVGGFSGIGFELSRNAGIIGIDVDHCVHDNGSLDDWVTQKIRQLDSYTEISPSGNGVHIFVFGEIPGDRRKKGNVEMYDSGRFFTVTGAHLDGTPNTIESHQEALNSVHTEVFDSPDAGATTIVTAPALDNSVVLKKAYNAKNGGKFKRLYKDGDTSDYPSVSEADLALCSELAFWTNGDQEWIDRLFRESALFRPKWDEQHGARTYGELTIAKACDGLQEGYLGYACDNSPPEQFFIGSRFAPKKVADVILSRYHFFTFADTEEVYVYDANTNTNTNRLKRNGHWQQYDVFKRCWLQYHVSNDAQSRLDDKCFCAGQDIYLPSVI